MEKPGAVRENYFKKEEKTMVGLQAVRKYGYFVVGGLFSLGLLISTQISLANNAYADEGHEHGDPMSQCS